MIGELVDILLLTGLGRDRGPSLATICTVHAVGATLGAALAVFAPGSLSLVGGMLAAAVLVAFLRSAPALVAAALIELTTYTGVRFLVWIHKLHI